MSIFALDADGTHLGAAYGDPQVRTRSVGRYYGWRSYFHGGPQDLPRDTPRDRIQPIRGAHLSAPFRSTTTRDWRIGVSIPVFQPASGAASETPVFAGVLVFSVDIGHFDFLATSAVQDRPSHERFAVLVDARADGVGGRIVFHPYFTEVAPADPNEPGRSAARLLIGRDLLGRMTRDWSVVYRDPLGHAPGGGAYQGPWIAAAQPLQLPGKTGTAGQAMGPDGLVVLVQERSDAATGPVVQMGRELVADGVLALLAIAAMVAIVWFLALHTRPGRPDRQLPAPLLSGAPRPLRERSTLSESGPEHG